MATLGTAAAIPFLMGGGKKDAGAKNTPPTNAGSKAEDDFIQYVLLLPDEELAICRV